jgi:sensor c-di-GMP phosphodiesterase-like protein
LQEERVGRRAVTAIAIVVGLAALAAPIYLSVHWAWQQSLNEQMAAVGSVADEVLYRAEQNTTQVRTILLALEKAGAPDPCSDGNIALMRNLAVTNEQVNLVGYARNDRLVCSTFGHHGDGIPLGPPASQTDFGTAVRYDFEFRRLPGRKFFVTSRVASGYTVMVHPNLPLQVFVDRAEVSVGLIGAASKRLIFGRGKFQPGWADLAGDSRATEFSRDEHLVAMRRSSRFPYIAFAAIPASAVEAGLVRTALVLVPVGLLAGVVLALAVFYLARQQMSLRTALRVALRRKEFFLLYQPIVELRGGRCVGAEALIRWRRSNGDMALPGSFIPVAEETGLIHDITKRVMDIVTRDAAAVVAAHPDLHIGINLSSKDLQFHDTPRLVREMVLAMGAKPHNILVEATERGFLQADTARKIVEDIHALKIKVAIDDFGTGYSSLSNLEKFKLDYLKIDKAFVDTVGGKSATSQVAIHIIEMAKSLKLEMIAEGVETAAQVTFLRERGVQYAQGYFFAKPLPLREFVAFVQKSEKLAASA